jgi:hypothetical protein
MAGIGGTAVVTTALRAAAVRSGYRFSGDGMFFEEERGSVQGGACGHCQGLPAPNCPRRCRCGAP